MLISEQEVEREMRELMANGASLGDAIRRLFAKGYGKLVLVVHHY
jgi:hypothetical protein